MGAHEHLSPQQFDVQFHGPHPFGGDFATVRRPGNDEPIGQMRYIARPAGHPWAEPIPHTHVGYVTVDEQHRGQGAARALYQAVHQATGLPFLHSRDDMSPEGLRAARSAARDNPAAHKVLAWKKDSTAPLGERQVVRALPRKKASA